MKRRIRLTESDLHRIVNRSVRRVLMNEGTIPNESVLSGIKEYISNDSYSLSQVMKRYPQLFDVISKWLLDNGDEELISFICHNFMDTSEYD